MTSLRGGIFDKLSPFVTCSCEGASLAGEVILEAALTVPVTSSSARLDSAKQRDVPMQNCIAEVRNCQNSYPEQVEHFSRAVEDDAAEEGTAGLVRVESFVNPGPHSLASLASEDIFPTGWCSGTTWMWLPPPPRSELDARELRPRWMAVPETLSKCDEWSLIGLSRADSGGQEMR